KKIALLSDTSRLITRADLNLKRTKPPFNNDSWNLRDRATYDSIQSHLPADQRDGWVSKLFKHKMFGLRDKFKDDPQEISTRLGEVFLHRLPYMLFISLPFFALILKLLYVRNKGIYYSDHAVFTLYHYIFSF